MKWLVSRMKTISKYRFRSGLEVDISKFLEENKVKYDYETLTINYLKPQQKSYYRPDFILDNGIIIEAKGLFSSADRKKHKIIKKQFGDEYDIRFVFSNSKNRIGKKSKTTYAKWCDLFGFKWHCIRTTGEYIPREWLKENGKR